MKSSPLCSRDDGREVFFTATDGDRKFRVTVPKAMLDDVLGTSAGEADRKAWVKTRKNEMLDLIEGGAPAQDRLAGVAVEELS